MPHSRLVASLVTALALALATAASGSTVQSASDPRSRCAGTLKELDPIELTLSADDAQLLPGAAVIVRGSITAWNDLSDVRVSLAPDGALELSGPSEISLGTIVRGATVDFQIPVRLTGAADAAVRATITARGEEPGEVFTRREGLYTVFRGGRAHANMGGYIFVALEAIQNDLRAGRINGEAAATQIREVTDTPIQTDQVPMKATRAPVLEMGGRELPDLTPAATEGQEVLSQRMRVRTEPGVNAATVRVHGQVNWTDENGTTHPCYGCAVQVRDDELIGSELVASAATYTDGSYDFTVDNDDGIGAGGRDIFVRVVLSNSAVEVRPSGGGDPYQRESGIHDNVADGADITENFTWDNNGTNSSCGVLTGASYIAAYAYFLNGNSFLAHLPVEWPGGSGSDYNGSRIRLGTGDRWDWDVLHHEYGHYVQDVFNIENNPGGAHSSSQCDSDQRGSKDVGTRLAFGEGWPTYFGTCGQDVLGLSGLGVPRVGDTGYADLEDGSLSYNLESQNSFGGEDNERAIMNTFWDLYDTNSDGRDVVSVDDQTLFDRINAVDPTTMSAAWAALRAPLNNTEDLQYGGISADHLMGPTLVAPANAAVMSPAANRNFSWNALVGCGAFAGNNFDLVFYNAATKAKVLTIPNLGSASHAITDGELATLAGGPHNLVWAVEGRNNQSPGTGPYLGENRALTVDRPPVANAGTDITAECASHTTTAVQLNGTGSSDPDGDPLTYTWSATGITFDNIHSATPTGQFPEGTTTVTLQVSDGILTDTDQVDVTVVDTTPPTITCPADITVECTSHQGTPATDPAIAAFLAGATATDVCDATPTLSNNGPAIFPEGVTIVTFKAVDDDLNQSTCNAKVNVVDTTPPELTLALSRDVLWPPNHKFADIAATVVVTDICDPNPTFVLTSITSNEPVDGLGDGDTSPDWANATTGTPDVAFQLRSERAGVGTGRIYTVTYTASDEAGNTTVKSATVRVPHDQDAFAMVANGYDPEGNDWTSGATSFEIVLPSLSYASLATGEEGISQRTPGEDPAGTPVSLALDAQKVDATRAWIGNGLGIVAADSWGYTDANGDGYTDVVFSFPVEAARALRDASLPEDGPLGLHFENGGADFLVPDIFALGVPVELGTLADVTTRNDALAALAQREAEGARGGIASVPSGPDGRGGQAAPEGHGTTPVQVQTTTPTEPPMPHVSEFAPIYPNPFAGDVTVNFALAAAADVSLAVYDIHGARVRQLSSGAERAGRFSITWDGRDESGRNAPSGVYFFRLDAGSIHQTRKALLSR